VLIIGDTASHVLSRVGELQWKIADLDAPDEGEEEEKKN
jgi:hypothetical protein